MDNTIYVQKETKTWSVLIFKNFRKFIHAIYNMKCKMNKREYYPSNLIILFREY